jgi:hypothetical protein
MAFTSLLGKGLDSFYIRNSKNLAGDEGPLKKYKVFTNLPKSQLCFPASADIGPLLVLEEREAKPCQQTKDCGLSSSWRNGLGNGEDSN